MNVHAFETAYNACMCAAEMPQFAGGDFAARFAELTRRLLAFDAHTNLTAVREMSDILSKHYADSLRVAAFVPHGARVLDVGCGGGFPCLPLAVVRPDLTITALDSTAKKLVFVEETAREMGLAVKTIVGRAEELAAAEMPMRESFDVVTARAVAALPVLAELCLPFVRVGGTFLAMKGARGEEELAAAASSIAKLGGVLTAKHRVDLPPVSAWYAGGDATAAERWVFAIGKKNSTPRSLPRAFGRIKKKPL